jgi:HlyD family secretion protein
MKRTHLLIVLTVVIILFLGFKYLTRAKPVTVAFQEVEIGKVEATVSNTRAGSVKARHRARLAPAIGGQIVTLNVQKSDVVKQGQVLLTLWNKDLLAELKLAQGQIIVAEATARENCLLADYADRQAKRQIELKRHSSTSESTYEDAVSTAAAKKAACQAAEAQRSVSQARVDAANAMVERTLLVAPFAGIVAEVNGEVGEYITPSPPGIATLPAIDLINLETLYIAAPIDEIDAAQIRPGMEARITLDAFPKRIFKGKTRSISPYVLEQAKQARTVDIEADFLEPLENSNLLVGYSADVEILLDSREQVVKIPSEAVAEGGYVYVLHSSDNHIERRKITTGLTNWRFTEVVSGLVKTEKVVTTIDREGLAHGIKVVIDNTIKKSDKK